VSVHDALLAIFAEMERLDVQGEGVALEALLTKAGYDQRDVRIAIACVAAFGERESLREWGEALLATQEGPDDHDFEPEGIDVTVGDLVTAVSMAMVIGRLATNVELADAAAELLATQGSRSAAARDAEMRRRPRGRRGRR
jgi:hypothetical protein